jgi:transcriptional regulator with XRE-family HTH domain
MRRPDARRVIDDVGRRVAELRREHGWTQLELAERWGVGVGYVEDVEGGKENLTIESLVLLAWVLRAQPADLFQTPASRAKRKPGRPRKTER